MRDFSTNNNSKRELEDELDTNISNCDVNFKANQFKTEKEVIKKVNRNNLVLAEIGWLVP